MLFWEPSPSSVLLAGTSSRKTSGFVVNRCCARCRLRTNLLGRSRMDQPLFLVLSISASIKRQQSCTGVLELMSPARDRRIMVLLYFDLKNAIQTNADGSTRGVHFTTLMSNWDKRCKEFMGFEEILRVSSTRSYKRQVRNHAA